LKNAATGSGPTISAKGSDTNIDFNLAAKGTGEIKAGSVINANGKLVKLAKGADVASAATLTLGSDGNQFDVTGTTTITAFTVASGLCFFVRFNASLTMTNNANIVTQSGANITTAAGDTCILRATSANVVEVLAYTPAKNQSVGYEQTWQDVTGSRALGTSYTNSTGKPIQVKVSAIASSAAVMTITVAGVGLPGGGLGSLPEGSAIVPNGATYSAALSAGTPSSLNWKELR
jgi:hypothetical protein